MGLTTRLQAEFTLAGQFVSDQEKGFRD